MNLPCVKNPVSLFWCHFLGMEVAANLHLLTERDNVWWRWKIKVFMAPELSTRSAASLYFIYQQSTSVFLANSLQTLEEFR